MQRGMPGTHGGDVPVVAELQEGGQRVLERRDVAAHAEPTQLQGFRARRGLRGTEVRLEDGNHAQLAI